MKQIQIADYTLKALASEKDSQLLFREKVAVAETVKEFGADIVELAAVQNPKEDKIIYKTLVATLGSVPVAIPCGMTRESAAFAFECVRQSEEPWLQVELPVSDVGMEYGLAMKKPALLKKAAELTKQACEICPRVEFIAGDASRADREFLAEVLAIVRTAGAGRITVADDEGLCLAEDVASLIRDAREAAGLPVFFRGNDSVRMAVANALAAVQAGADGIKCAVLGDNVLRTADFARALSGKAGSLGCVCNLELTQIHSDIDSLLGRITGGDYLSGGAAASSGGDVYLDAASSIGDVADASRSLGYDLSDADVGKVFDALKGICDRKSSVGAKELEAIIASSAMQAPSTYHLKSFNISTGNITGAMAHIVLVGDDGAELSGIATGDGPIDAAFRAIEDGVGFHYELDDFQVQAVTEGKESLGATLVRLRSEGKLYSGNGLSTDIVGASIRAYVNALNKIVYEESRK